MTSMVTLPGTIPYLLQAIGARRGLSNVTDYSLLCLTSCSEQHAAHYIKLLSGALSAARHRRYNDSCPQRTARELLCGNYHGYRSDVETNETNNNQLLKRLLRHLNLHLHADRLSWTTVLLMCFSLLRPSDVLATGGNKRGEQTLQSSRPFIHGLLQCSPSDLGLLKMQSNTRGSGSRLV